MHFDFETPWRLAVTLAVLASLLTVCHGQWGCGVISECTARDYGKSLDCSDVKEMTEIWRRCTLEIHRVSAKYESLDLSRNNLDFYPNSFINECFERINFSTNVLHTLPKEFASLTNLTVLDLSHNGIQHSKDLALLEQLPKLQILYLSYNHLKSLDNLSSLSLLELHVDHCQIKELSNRTFRGLPKLMTLSLAGNALKTLNFGQNTPRISPTIKFLDISDCFDGFQDNAVIYAFPQLMYVNVRNNGEWRFYNFLDKNEKLQAINGINYISRYELIFKYTFPNLKYYSQSKLEEIQWFVFSPFCEAKRLKNRSLLQFLDSVDEIIENSTNASKGHVTDNSNGGEETGVREFGVWIIILICLSIGLLFAIMFFYTFECSPSVRGSASPEPRTILTTNDPRCSTVSTSHYCPSAPTTIEQAISAEPPSYEEAIRVSKLEHVKPPSFEDSNARKKY